MLVNLKQLTKKDIEDIRVPSSIITGRPNMINKGNNIAVLAIASAMDLYDSRAKSEIYYFVQLYPKSNPHWESSRLFEVVDSAAPEDWTLVNRKPLQDSSYCVGWTLGPKEWENPKRDVYELDDSDNEYNPHDPRYIALEQKKLEYEKQSLENMKSFEAWYKKMSTI